MSTNPVNNLTAAQLREAADLRDQIEAMEARLQALLSGGKSASTTAAAPTAPKAAKKEPSRKAKKGKRVLSPEALERIRAGQAKRWAKVRASEEASAAPKPAKKKRAGRKAKSAKPAKPAKTQAAAAGGKAPKRKMSAEGRARIQAAVKARWERARAAKAAAGSEAPKKKAAGKKARKKA